jgi:hypothetical protein
MRLRALFRLWGLIVVPVSVVALSRAEGDALKALAPPGLRIGAALNQRQVDGLDKVGQTIVTRHFNTITSENLLKWALVHPEPDRYEFRSLRPLRHPRGSAQHVHRRSHLDLAQADAGLGFCRS